MFGNAISAEKLVANVPPTDYPRLRECLSAWRDAHDAGKRYGQRALLDRASGNSYIPVDSDSAMKLDAALRATYVSLDRGETQQATYSRQMPPAYFLGQ